ncbi:MAG: hypothetical protein HOL31_07635 [Candidatus Scalindua sp.]|jgi:hypothetical protein|nr:hypothetical protein [Candidatus Scalindua sp.]
MKQMFDNKETYDFVVDCGLGEKNPVFELSKLTQWEFDQIEDNSTITTTDSKSKKSFVKYLGGKVRSLKFDYALKDWRNVVDKDNKTIKFNSDNKKKLANWIRIKIVEKIDEDNELNEPESEAKDKEKK